MTKRRLKENQRRSPLPQGDSYVGQEPLATHPSLPPSLTPSLCRSPGWRACIVRQPPNPPAHRQATNQQQHGRNADTPTHPPHARETRPAAHCVSATAQTGSIIKENPHFSSLSHVFAVCLRKNESLSNLVLLGER